MAKKNQEIKAVEPPIGATCHYERDKNGKWWVVWSGDFLGDEPSRKESPDSDYLEIGYQQCHALIRQEERDRVIQEIEDNGYYGQVKHLDLDKGWVEKTMWCLPESWWQNFKKGKK